MGDRKRPILSRLPIALRPLGQTPQLEVVFASSRAVCGPRLRYLSHLHRVVVLGQVAGCPRVLHACCQRHLVPQTARRLACRG